MDNLNYLINRIAADLTGTNADNGHQAAWWILESISGKNRAELLAIKNFELSNDQAVKLEDWLNKLKFEHFPLQYLIGSMPFLNLNINVEVPILIPRPETEEWVQNLIDKYSALKNEKLFVLDIGSGSGCIGLSIAKAFPYWTVIGVDISDKAIALSEKNKSTNSISNINFIKSDLFECVPDIQFDFIISNPPYISQKQYEELDRSVAIWEDKQALVASFDGLSIIKKIISNSKKFLSKKYLDYPKLALEIDFTHGSDVDNLLKNAGFFNIEIKKDFANKDRVALAYFDN